MGQEPGGPVEGLRAVGYCALDNLLLGWVASLLGGLGSYGRDGGRNGRGCRVVSCGWSEECHIVATGEGGTISC